MYLVRVIALVNMPPSAPQVLDYFWTASLLQGSLVRVTMGRRKLAAIVLESVDIRHAKSGVKKSLFELKRIEGVISEIPQLSSAQIELARWISVYYASSLSTSLRTVAPPFLGSVRSHVDHSAVPQPLRGQPPLGTLVLTEPNSARAQLSRIVRSTEGQVLIMVPERSLINLLSAGLMGSDIVHFHGGMSAREYRAVYQAVLDGSARIVIGTRIALFLPWTHLKHIVVEDPLHEAYKNDMAPRYNAPDVARYIAGLYGSELTLLSPALSTVQYHLRSRGSLTVTDQKPYWPSISLVSMEQEQLDGGRSLFSRVAQDALLHAYENRSPVLVMSPRRGYATIARCGRCRKSVACATCSAPMRWHRTSENMLVCYRCASFQEVPRQCPSCQSGTLRPSGLAGSQKYVEAINVLLDRYGHKTLKIPVLDSDLVRTEADETERLSTLDAMEHPILVATQMILSHRYMRHFETIVVPHLNAMAYNPDFRTQERLITVLEKLADFKPDRMIVQSWHDENALGNIASRQWEDFYRDELTQRKSLQWPPFARIVLLSYRHRNRSTAVRDADHTRDLLQRALRQIPSHGTRIIGPGPALVEYSRGVWTQRLLLKSAMSGPRLAAFLDYVPPGWIIDVDPKSIA